MWRRIPPQVKSFLLKAFVLFAVWKALYLLVLLPNRILDRPLTYAVSIGTVKTLNAISRPSQYTASEGKHLKGDGRDGVLEDVVFINFGRERRSHCR